MMKSQDILIMLKIISLRQHDIEDPEQYSARGLAASTGISKSQINVSIRRSQAVGLVRKDRKRKLPDVNRKALFKIIESAVKYVFPANPGEVDRGMVTNFDAPVLQGILSSVGEFKYVWPDATSEQMGQKIEPLYRTAPFAAKHDERLYIMLALVDAIRLGNQREVRLASKELLKAMTE